MATMRGLAGCLYAVPGLALQSYGLFADSMPAVISGTAMLCLGLAGWSRLAGYHPGWGLCGIIPLLALILSGQSPEVPPAAPVAPVVAEPLRARTLEPKVESVAADPQPEPVSEPEPVSFEEGYSQLKIGMTLDEVKALVGNDMTVISQSASSMLARWEGGERRYFNARFKQGKVDLVARLQTEAMPEAADGADQDEGDGMTEASPPQDDAATEEEAPVEQKSTKVIMGRAKREQVVRVGEGTQRKPRPLVGRARLPRSSGRINRGANDVNIFNHSENAVQVGVRLGMRGIDLTIEPGGMGTVFLSNGTYSISYIDEGDPKTLRSGGTLVVDSPPAALRVDLGREEGAE